MGGAACVLARSQPWAESLRLLPRPHDHRHRGLALDVLWLRDYILCGGSAPAPIPNLHGTIHLRILRGFRLGLLAQLLVAVRAHLPGAICQCSAFIRVWWHSRASDRNVSVPEES